MEPPPDADALFPCRALIVDLIKKLQAEAGVGQKVPKDGATPDSSPVPAASAAAPKPAAAAAAAAAAPAEKKVEKKSSVSSDTVEVTCTFAAPAKEVFECFVVPQRVSAYTQSRAEVLCPCLNHSFSTPRTRIERPRLFSPDSDSDCTHAWVSSPPFSGRDSCGEQAHSL